MRCPYEISCFLTVVRFDSMPLGLLSLTRLFQQCRRFGLVVKRWRKVMQERVPSGKRGVGGGGGAGWWRICREGARVVGCATLSLILPSMPATVFWYEISYWEFTLLLHIMRFHAFSAAMRFAYEISRCVLLMRFHKTSLCDFKLFCRYKISLWFCFAYCCIFVWWDFSFFGRHAISLWDFILFVVFDSNIRV